MIKIEIERSDARGMLQITASCRLEVRMEGSKSPFQRHQTYARGYSGDTPDEISRETAQVVRELLAAMPKGIL